MWTYVPVVNTSSHNLKKKVSGLMVLLRQRVSITNNTNVFYCEHSSWSWTTPPENHCNILHTMQTKSMMMIKNLSVTNIDKQYTHMTELSPVNHAKNILNRACHLCWQWHLGIICIPQHFRNFSTTHTHTNDGHQSAGWLGFTGILIGLYCCLGFNGIVTVLYCWLGFTSILIGLYCAYNQFFCENMK